MHNFSIVRSNELTEEVDQFINNALSSGFKLFDQYFDDEQSEISLGKKTFYDKLIKYKEDLSIYLENPTVFEIEQRSMFEYIYSADQQFNDEEKLFFEFMLGLCRFQFCLKIVVDFCEFLESARGDLEFLFSKLAEDSCKCSYCLQENPFWKSLHRFSNLGFTYTTHLIEVTKNFEIISFWDLASDFYEKKQTHKLFSEYLVSMQFVPEEKKFLGLAQTLHWGGFGGSGKFIDNYPQLEPLLKHRIGYHAKESGGFNNRLDSILKQLVAMKQYVKSITPILLKAQFSECSKIKVLDVGSGPNYLGAVPVLDFFKKQNCFIELTASDVDVCSISALLDKKKTDECLKEVRFLDLNLVSEIPDDYIVENSYDIVTASLVLHQLSYSQINEVLSFFVRLLKPGGIIINSDVGKASYYQCLLGPSNEIDREGNVLPFQAHTFMASSFLQNSDKAKIAYPIRSWVKGFPSDTTALYSTVIYQIIETPCSLINNLDTLWKAGQYVEADRLVAPFAKGHIMPASIKDVDKDKAF